MVICMTKETNTFPAIKNGCGSVEQSLMNNLWCKNGIIMKFYTYLISEDESTSCIFNGFIIIFIYVCNLFVITTFYLDWDKKNNGIFGVRSILIFNRKKKTIIIFVFFCFFLICTQTEPIFLWMQCIIMRLKFCHIDRFRKRQ